MTATAQEPQDWREEHHYREAIRCDNCKHCVFCEGSIIGGFQDGGFYCEHPDREPDTPTDETGLCDQYEPEEQP